MQKKQSYAWIVFAAGFLMVFTVLGFGNSPKGTFLSAVTASMDLKRSLYAFSDSARYITTAVLSFFFGKLIGKFGARRLVAAGFMCMILSSVTNATAHSYPQLYLGGVFLGAGIGWTTTSMVGYIVGKWFTNEKGTLMGILLAASGLGGLASEQTVTRIIYGADGSVPLDMGHWRKAYLIIAVLYLIIGAAAVLVIRDTPEQLGLQPLGRDKPAKKKRGSSWEGIDISGIRGKPYFYLIFLCIFMSGFSLQSMINMAKPYMYDLGFDKGYVIYVFSLFSILLTIAKISTGFIFDRAGLRPTFLMCCLAGTASMFMLSQLKLSSQILPWCYACISAFAFPLETVMLPLTVLEMFGQKEYSRLLGYITCVNTLGFACGVPVTNLVYDRCGTYLPIIRVLTGVFVALTVLSQIAMAMAKRDREKA